MSWRGSRRGRATKFYPIDVATVAGHDGQASGNLAPDEQQFRLAVEGCRKPVPMAGRGPLLVAMAVVRLLGRRTPTAST